jgi:serine/threonine protein kinase
MQDNYEIILSILNKGDNIVDYLFSQDKLCQKIFDRKNSKLLGKGREGTVYEFFFDKKKYAMKINKRKLIRIKNNKKLTLKEYADKYIYDAFISKLFIKINGGDENKILNYYFKFDDLDLDCNEYYQRYSYKRFDNGKELTFKKSYLCKSHYHSEYVIGLICAQFYKKNISINFIDIYGFNTCLVENKKSFIQEYVFMEKIDNDLKKILNCVEDFMLPCLFVQLYHAIHLYQSLKISHNDLHSENIFIKYINNDTMFNGKKLIEYKYFHYKLGDQDIFTPYIPFVIKIGDFGYSFKYSEPVIGDIQVIEGGFQENFPNWFSKCYDTVYSTIYILQLLKRKKTDFIKNLIEIVFGDSINYVQKNYMIVDGAKINPESLRPRINTIEKNFGHITAEKLLLNKNLFPKSFYQKPSSKYITLGKI